MVPKMHYHGATDNWPWLAPFLALTFFHMTFYVTNYNKDQLGRWKLLQHAGININI